MFRFRRKRSTADYPGNDQLARHGFTKIADGFDFPVGKPEGEGYYKARGFR